MMKRPELLRVATIFILGFTAIAPAQTNLPSLDDVLKAKQDLWGEAAMRQPNGASYEFFEKLLPPPRYVNADFHYYPIVLSAPNATVKARLISNGSGVNLRGGARGWNDIGTPVIFRVGPDEFRFGDIRERLREPVLAEGFLPIVQIDYEHPTPRHDNGKAAFQSATNDPAAEVYRLEAFAATDSALASNGVVLVRFSLANGANGTVTAQIDSKPVTFADGKVTDDNGNVLAWFDSAWTWERGAVHAKISTNKSATLAIATKPVPADVSRRKLDADAFDEQRRLCTETWKKILAAGMNVETPEPLVNNAWKHLIIQDFMLINGDRMNYSAGNQYQKMYAAESSDGAVPLLQFGYEEDFRRLLPVILDLVDRRLTNHFAAHKLANIPKWFWQTRDADFVNAMRARWQAELDWILTQRGGEHGLLPKDNYCTDIEMPTYSLCANASCWADLRDMASVLNELGDEAEARRVAGAAAEYKMRILAAVEKNLRTETQPPFVPMSLFFDEGLHDPIIGTRVGSYWNLVCGYAVGSGIFAGSNREGWIPNYQETHGGLCMGLIRSGADNHTFWTGKHRTNPLYGLRYNLDTLRRDDPERALVSFYGMLAHGMTRNTFEGAEGCSLQPLDDGGRFFYCPPNSSSSGQWLSTLRHLLVQDLDLENDGKPETLRLCFATPKRWLEDGKVINVEHAPTAFGQVSLRLESKLSAGEVVAEVDLPHRDKPKQTLLRVRVPDNWRVKSADADGKNLTVDDKGTVDISKLAGMQKIRFAVTK